MPPVDPSQVINDPDFQALSDADRHKFLMTADPDYAALAPGDQTRFLSAVRLNQSAQGEIHAPWDLGKGPLPSSAPRAPWDYGQTPLPRSENDQPGKARPFTLDRPATDSLVNQSTLVPPDTSELGSLYENANTAGDVVQGGVKKVGRAALNLSPAIRKIPKVGPALVPSAPDYNPAADPVEGAKGLMQNQNTAEKVGDVATTAAEYMLPGMGEEAASERLASWGIPKLIGRALYGAGTNAAIEATNGGSAKDTAIAGGVGAALPFAGKAVEPIVNRIRGEAPKLMQSALDVAPKEFRYGRNPAQGVVEEGIKGDTPEELKQQVSARYVQRAQEVQQALARVPNADMDLTHALDPLDKAQSLAKDQGNVPLANRIEQIKQRLSQKHQMFRIMGRNDAPIDFFSGELPAPGSQTDRFISYNTGPVNFNAFSPSEANALKMHVGEMAKWTPAELQNPDAQAINSALRQVYHNINSEIDRAVPGTKLANNRVGELMSAKHALEIAGQKELAAGSKIPPALKRVLRRGALIGSLGSLGGFYGDKYDKGNIARDALIGATVGGLGDLAAEPAVAKMEDPAFLSRFAQFTRNFPSGNKLVRPFGAAAMTAYDESRTPPPPPGATHIVRDREGNIIGHIVNGNFVRQYTPPGSE